MVTNGEVLLVDEHTGRILPGRRYNEGLHQAIEAKEHVEVKAENQTFATITLQNYFRMYDKLAGMTGTAETEAAEFMGTYKLGVLPIPTNRPMIRQDKDDLIFRTKKEKLAAIVKDVAERHATGQPLLLGTASVESSEVVSSLLDVVGIELKEIKEQLKEEHPDVVDVGGLYVLGTERHESRRIDIQLRGRSGRQGDPGESRFYLSLEDDLMRLFNTSAPRRRSSRRSSRTWPSATPRASRCCWAPRPSNRRKSSRRCSTWWASSTRCSTRSSTRRTRPSWPRRAARAP